MTDPNRYAPPTGTVAMALRPATVDDVGAIRRVAREGWHAAYDDVVGADAVDEQVDEWYAPEVLEDAIAREDWAYLVADGDDGVVGFASGGPTEEGPADGVLAAIYVRPDRWDEGVGSSLLSAIHGDLRSLGCGSVWLAVLAENDVGRSFYRSHGYRRHDEQTTTVGGVEAGELILRRSL